MRITALSGGVGGARFLRGLLDALLPPGGPGAATEVTVVGNTADDVTLRGLRVCPDLDSVMYTLGGGADEARGWGREGETFTTAGELAAHDAALGLPPQWFALGDRDTATHVLRTRMLAEGVPLGEVTTALSARWGLADLGVRLLPATDDRAETHVLVDGAEAPLDAASVRSPLAAGLDAPPGTHALHFQEWWVRHGARPLPRAVVVAGSAAARPAPGVLEAVAAADVVLLPPSNPVVSLGAVLAVPGLRDALRRTAAPVVGVSPLVGGRPVRGHADACLRAVGVPATARDVAALYADLLDGWLVAPGDEHGDGPALPGAVVRPEPLLMTTRDDAARIARAALDLAAELAADADLDVRRRSRPTSAPAAHAGMVA